MFWLFVILALAVVGAVVAFAVSKSKGGGGYAGIKKLAIHRGWHFSRPEGTSHSYALSAETMLTAGDGSSMDWRVRWRVRVSKDEGKDKTEIVCGDVLLEKGFVFVNPRSEASGIKAMQRAAAADHEEAVKKVAAWKEQQSRAHEVVVGSGEFQERYFVSATTSEGVAKRIISQRVQKAMLALPPSQPIKIRAGSDGVVLSTVAVFAVDRIESLISLEDMLIANVGQEQSVGGTKVTVS